MSSNRSYETIEDLLSDDSFIQYCLNKDEEAVRYWTAWLYEHPDKREIAELAKESLTVLLVEMEDVSENTRLFRQKLDDHTGHREASGTNMKRIRLLRWGMVASVFLAVTTWFILQYTGKETIATGIDEVKTVRLPDGSTMTMNTATSVSYSKAFNRNRVIYLEEGEAFFDVEHRPESPFVVETSSGMRVEDIGTAFSVKSYQKLEEEAIQVQEGVVNISNTDNQAIQLTENQSLRVNKKTKQLSFSKADSASTSGWLNGQVALYDAGFDELSLALENTFGIPVEFPDPGIKNCRITILFENDQEIEHIFSMLKSIYNVSIWQDQGKIIISGKPCSI